MSAEAIRSSRGPWLLGLVLLGCLFARGALVSKSDPEGVSTRWTTVGDATLYDKFGWNLASRGVLGLGDRPSGFVMPGYPVFLAGVYKVAGHHPGAVRWVQVLLSVATAIMLGQLARMLGGPRSGLIAVAIASIYPFFIYFVPEILTETLFIFAFTAMLVTAANAGRTGSILSGVLHGASLALAILTRPVALIMEPGALFLARPWARENRGRRLTGLALGFLVVALGWGGWVARNASVFGEFVPFDTHGGFTLYTGTLISRGVDHSIVVKQTTEQLGYYRYDLERGTLPPGRTAELDLDRHARAKAIELIRADMPDYYARIPKNIGALWLNREMGEVNKRASVAAIAGWLSYGPVLLFGALGLWRAWRERRRDMFAGLLWVLLATTALFGATHAGKRYRVATIDPVLIVLAAWEVDSLARFRRPRTG